MTAQEVFDRVVAHLREQGCKALDDGLGCAYRSADGRKCAAGSLIPDALYHPEYEGLTALSFDLVELWRTLQIDPAHVAWLQDIHDDHCVNEWEDMWREGAAQRGLVYTPPKEGGAA